MVRVNRVINRSEAERCGRSDVSKVCAATVAAGDLARTVHFYRRIFGFRLERTTGDGPLASAWLNGSGGARLVIQSTRSDTVRPVSSPPRLGFVVRDLDEAREALWESGVSPSRDSGEADHIFRRDDGRALYIRDPDGNEIELVEEGAARCQASLSRRCRIGRWRRVMRRRCSAAG